jgi:membrane protein
MREEFKGRVSHVLVGIVALSVALMLRGQTRPLPAPARHDIAEPQDTDDIPPERAKMEAHRGREAAKPTDIPPPGWKDILTRAWRRIGADNHSLVAAGVAFYAMLAVFPALAAFVSIFGLVADPQTVRQTAIQASAFMPPEAATLLLDALTALVNKANSKLNLALLVGLGIAVWSARTGIAALMTGLNIAYEEGEKRGFIKQQIVALSLTFGALIFAGVVVVALAVIPAAIAFLPFSEAQRTTLGLARWPVLAVLMMVGVAILYRFAPSRRQPQWRWISWGAALATAVWILASAAFSYYVSRFGSYDAMYGSLGAVIVLLLWFWLSALVLLIGATLNAESEHQTLRDTTVGQPKPMGERGAHVADTVGASTS